jgi:hypothetical protein
VQMQAQVQLPSRFRNEGIIPNDLHHSGQEYRKAVSHSTGQIECAVSRSQMSWPT